MGVLGIQHGIRGGHRAWIEKYGEQNAPSVSTIRYNVEKFKTTGCIHDQVMVFCLTAFATNCTMGLSLQGADL